MTQSHKQGAANDSKWSVCSSSPAGRHCPRYSPSLPCHSHFIHSLWTPEIQHSNLTDHSWGYASSSSSKGPPGASDKNGSIGTGWGPHPLCVPWYLAGPRLGNRRGCSATKQKKRPCFRSPSMRAGRDWGLTHENEPCGALPCPATLSLFPRTTELVIHSSLQSLYSYYCIVQLPETAASSGGRSFLSCVVCSLRTHLHQFPLLEISGKKDGMWVSHKDINGTEERHIGRINTENGLGHWPGLCSPYTKERPTLTKHKTSCDTRE